MNAIALRGICGRLPSERQGLGKRRTWDGFPHLPLLWARPNLARDGQPGGPFCWARRTAQLIPLLRFPFFPLCSPISLPPNDQSFRARHSGAFETFTPAFPLLIRNYSPPNADSISSLFLRNPSSSARDGRTRLPQRSDARHLEAQRWLEPQAARERGIVRDHVPRVDRPAGQVLGPRESIDHSSESVRSRRRSLEGARRAPGGEDGGGRESGGARLGPEVARAAIPAALAPPVGNGRHWRYPRWPTGRLWQLQADLIDGICGLEALRGRSQHFGRNGR